MITVKELKEILTNFEDQDIIDLNYIETEIGDRYEMIINDISITICEH